MVKNVDLERTTRSKSETPSVTTHEQLYWDFWEQFRNRVADERPEWRQPKPTSRTAPKSDIATGTSYTALTSIFGSDGLRVQITFKHADPSINTARFDSLHSKKDQFEKALGTEAVWDSMAGLKSSRVYVASNFLTVADIARWPQMIDWLLGKNDQFLRAIRAVQTLEADQPSQGCFTVPHSEP